MAFLDETGLAELWSLVRGADVNVAMGGYTGTGTYGTNNKNSLTFDFAPKLLVILQDVSGNTAPNGWGAIMLSNSEHYSLIPNAANSFRLHWSNNVSWSGNTVSWYNTANTTNGASAALCTQYQLNESGMTYKYIAFG